MKLIAALVVSLSVTACATSYGPSVMGSGGYKDARLDENTFTINTSSTWQVETEQELMNMALRRAAELTQQNGFDYFVIVNADQSSTSAAMLMPGQTTYRAVGNTVQATGTPALFAPIHYPKAGLTVKAFKGTKPAENPYAYDAASVLKYAGK